MTEKTVSGPSSDVLLSIFSHLDFRHRPIERAVCKDWLAVVDNNKSLWRVFEWIQKGKESSRTIIDWFDDKSGSTLEEASIAYKPKPPKPPVISLYYNPQNDYNPQHDSSPELQEEQLHLLDVILKSSPSLRMVSIRMGEVKGDNEKVQRILASSPRLTKLLFWEDADPQGFYPISRLFSNRSNPPNELQILWGPGLTEGLDMKRFESLKSYADVRVMSPGQFRDLLVNFSATLVHLNISIVPDGFPDPPPLEFPHLKVFEGDTGGPFPTGSWMISPNLKQVVLKALTEHGLAGLPPSLEELWIQSCSTFLPENFESLLYVAPALTILKVAKRFFRPPGFRLGLQPPPEQMASLADCVVRALRERKEMLEGGEEIQGMGFVPLQKLIIPLDEFSSTQLDELREIAGEVIDVKDYPDFINVEY